MTGVDEVDGRLTGLGVRCVHSTLELTTPKLIRSLFRIDEVYRGQGQGDSDDAATSSAGSATASGTLTRRNVPALLLHTSPSRN